MAFTGDIAELRRLQRTMQSLAQPGSATQRRVMAPVVPAVKALFAEQFREGIGPDGAKLKPRKDGKPALQSEKLARGAVKVEVVGTGVNVSARNAHLDDILTTQDEGRVFAPHTTTQFRVRGKTATTGRLVSRSKFLRRVRDAAVYHRKGSDEWTYTRDDKRGRSQFRGERRNVMVGLRVLPGRPIRPHGAELPARFGKALGRALFLGMRTVLDGVR